MEIDPAVLTFLGLIITFIGGYVTEKIRARATTDTNNATVKIESESSAVQLVTVLMAKQAETDKVVMELKASFDSLSWRYFLALRSLADHRDEWPSGYEARLPELHPVIADDLENGPSFGLDKEL